jgi:PAS domain S-box-containing protein
MAQHVLQRAAGAARELWRSGFGAGRRTMARLEHLRRRWRQDKAELGAAERLQLQLANERLRVAISAGGIGAWEYDPAADLAEASPEMRAMFGFSNDARINPQAIHSIMAAEDAPQAQQALSKALDPAGDGQYRATFRIRRASDGEERWIRCAGQAFFAQGRAVRLVGASRDVTNEITMERLLAEKSQLAEQLSTMAACVASMPGVIGTMRRSPEGKDCFPYVSANFTDLYGFHPDEAKADIAAIKARRHPEDKERYQAAIDESARTLSMLHEEFRWEHPRKGMIWIEVQGQPVAEQGGGVLWHGYLHDVTARKRAEEELRANEARHRAFFDSNLIGVCYTRCVAGVEGVVTDANDKYLDIIGYDRADLAAGRINWIALTAPEYQHVNQSVMAELMATGRTERVIEKEYIRKDGSRVPVVIACATLDMAAHAGVAFVLDISEQKQNEARVQKLHAGRIAVMQSMAAGIAHEINQPLTATVAYLRALRRLFEMKPEQRPTSIAETLERALAQIMRAGEIVSRLRSFIAHGEPDKFPLSVHELIQNAFDEAGQAMKEEQIKATLRLNAAQDSVLADKVQIVQVLVNLITNAAEAMESVPRRELEIATTSCAGEIRIDVIDTGVGLSEKAKSSLFEPFETTKPSGMGVGLSISRVIIEAHHGRIWAGSNPEGGAVFSFTLPLASSQNEAAQISEAAASAAPIAARAPADAPN